MLDKGDFSNLYPGHSELSWPPEWTTAVVKAIQWDEKACERSQWEDTGITIILCFWLGRKNFVRWFWGVSDVQLV